jgi:hypothetical protein
VARGDGGAAVQAVPASTASTPDKTATTRRITTSPAYGCPCGRRPPAPPPPRRTRPTVKAANRLNVNGSGISLGHPIGATGARMMVTLLHELRRRGGGLGLETMCIGGGQGMAAVFEVPAFAATT